MGKRKGAEFAENEETLAVLRQFGVDLVQGYDRDKPQGHPPAAGRPDA
ncbi:MAG: hypothetical protein ACK5RC_07440 [Curvibacter sp.]|nr:hypothetical protein [Curvibacter sp.]